MKETESLQNGKLRNMQILGSKGHLSICWSKEDDQKMKKEIQRMMDDGYLFFKYKKSFIGKKKLKEIKDINKVKQEIVASDETLKTLVENVQSLSVTDAEPQDDQHQLATKADEVVKGDVVAVPPASGG